jgi:hypothetical protein
MANVVQTVEPDSRSRGNDDAGRARREYRHSHESWNPSPKSLSLSESQIVAMMSFPPMVFRRFEGVKAMKP